MNIRFELLIASVPVFVVVSILVVLIIIGIVAAAVADIVDVICPSILCAVGC